MCALDVRIMCARRRTRASAAPADTFADIMQMCHAVRGRLPRLYTCCHSFVHARVQNPGHPSLSNSSSLVLTSISCACARDDALMAVHQPPLPSCAPRSPWLRREHARVTARSVMPFVICQLSRHYIMVALLVTCIKHEACAPNHTHDTSIHDATRVKLTCVVVYINGSVTPRPKSVKSHYPEFCDEGSLNTVQGQG